MIYMVKKKSTLHKLIADLKIDSSFDFLDKLHKEKDEVAVFGNGELIAFGQEAKDEVIMDYL